MNSGPRQLLETIDGVAVYEGKCEKCGEQRKVSFLEEHGYRCYDDIFFNKEFPGMEVVVTGRKTLALVKR